MVLLPINRGRLEIAGSEDQTLDRLITRSLTRVTSLVIAPTAPNHMNKNRQVRGFARLDESAAGRPSWTSHSPTHVLNGGWGVNYRWLVLLSSAVVFNVGPVLAHDPDTVELDVPEVTVLADRPHASSSQQFIPDKEYILQPQGRPAQVLRLIPGFVAVEHSGGAGKADQYFLRGFDADHGTDVAFFSDGMPINFRSHAHGQGYADLNFIIPETIEGLDVSKGAYLPEYGDFDTAGAVNFRTRDVVKEGIVQAAGGQFDTQRYILMFSPTKDRIRTLFAGEGYYTNGPFLSDNRYFRANLLGKVTTNLSSRDELSLTATFHKAQWNASGEIPLRTVTDGTLDRFGAIDPSEGGKTLRSTARLNYHYDTQSGGELFANAYGQYYKYDLYTNFTFFLNDPVNGDGFQQHDTRVMYGGDLGYKHRAQFYGMPSTGTFGFQTRVDDIHARLGTQVRRNPLSTTADSHILEASYAPYLKAEVQPLPWMRLTGGLRAETFTFNVRGPLPGLCRAAGGTHLLEHRAPEGQSDSGPMVPDRVLRQLRRRLPQQRCTFGGHSGFFTARSGTNLRAGGTFETLGTRGDGIDRDPVGHRPQIGIGIRRR